MSVGNRIKELRKGLHLTQEEFAKKIFRVKSTISNIESDKVELSPSLRLAICNVFNVHEDWIMTGEGEKFYIPFVNPLDKSTPIIHGTCQSEFRVSEALTMCARVLES